MSSERYIIKEPWYKKYARTGSTILSLLVLCMFFSIATPDFLNAQNLMSIVRACSVTIIMTMGMLIVILTGGIDLSVGPIIAVVGVLLATMLVGGMHPWLAVVLAILLGCFMGFINGFFVSVFKLQAFLVTLATQTIFRGFSLLYTKGRPVSNVPSSFCSVVGGKIGGWLPMPVVIMIATVIIFALVVKYRKVGVYAYAIGSNEEASRLSGIHVTKYKIYIYMIDGLLCALAAVTMLGRLGAAEPTAAAGYELNAISACAIGGASLAGGKGSVMGAVIGALIMQVLTNGMTLLNVQSYYQQIVTGIVILIAVLIDRFMNRETK
ncbi:MAG: ABC transporter permease [Dorea sp.]|nr:ABC transporter permease [Dorea sp.]